MDFQIMTPNYYLKKINLRSSMQHNKVIRTFDKHSLNDFLNELSYEMWDTTFCSEDVNLMFNAFLDNYLKFFYTCFPKKVIQLTPKRNDWTTLGIRISCNYKCQLYAASINNPDIRDYHKKYSKVLASVINK